MKNLLTTAIAIFGFTTISMSQLPSYVPANGLVGYYPFNGNANDESGNNLNGTVNGATLISDRFGDANSAYYFNGTTDDISVNANSLLDFQTTNKFSLSYWINPSTLSSTQVSFILCKQNSAGLNQDGWNSNIELNFSTAFRIQNGTSTNSCYLGSNPSTINTNVNYHIVHIYDNGIFYIYLNGVLLNQGTCSAIIGDNTSNMLIGKPTFTSSNSKVFNGLIDDIGIWNRALTLQEISDIYNASNCANDLTISPSINHLQLGSTATFNATSSDPTPSFLWQSDFGQGFQTLNNYGNYSGVNTNALSISSLQLANHAQPIRVISTSGNCIDTSNVATINITDTCIVTTNDTITTLISVTDTLIINTQVTGLTPPNTLNTIKVFPNPANDHITIDYGNFTTMIGYTLKITNVLGQIVFTTPINQQSSYVDLSTWNGNGIYYVQIIDAQNNTIENRKIVLQ